MLVVWSNDEKGSHVISQCEEAYTTCIASARWFGVTTVGHAQSLMNLNAFSNILRNIKCKCLASSLWSCVAWLIRKARNEFIFNGVDFRIDKMVEEMKAKLWSSFYVRRV